MGRGRHFELLAWELGVVVVLRHRRRSICCCYCSGSAACSVLVPAWAERVYGESVSSCVRRVEAEEGLLVLLRRLGSLSEGEIGG